MTYLPIIVLILSIVFNFVLIFKLIQADKVIVSYELKNEECDTCGAC